MAEYKGGVSVLPDRKIVFPAYAAGEHVCSSWILCPEWPVQGPRMCHAGVAEIF